MAVKISFLLVPVTLSFLLVLGVQGTEATSIAVIFHGIVQCSSNPSTIVSNATLQVVINGTTVVATGQTTSMGRFWVTMDMTSAEQLISLVSNSSIRVVSTAPPHACGTSGNAVVKLDQSPITLSGYRLLGEISKAKLLDFIHTIINALINETSDNAAADVEATFDGSDGPLNISTTIDDESRRYYIGRINNEGLFVDINI